MNSLMNSKRKNWVLCWMGYDEVQVSSRLTANEAVARWVIGNELGHVVKLVSCASKWYVDWAVLNRNGM